MRPVKVFEIDPISKIEDRAGLSLSLELSKLSALAVSRLQRNLGLKTDVYTG